MSKTSLQTTIAVITNEPSTATIMIFKAGFIASQWTRSGECNRVSRYDVAQKNENFSHKISPFIFDVFF